MKTLIYLLVLTTYFYSSAQNKVSNESAAVSAALDEVKEATSELARVGFYDGTFDVSVKFNNVYSDENSLELKIWFLSFKKQRNRSIDNSYTAKYQFKTSERKGSTFAGPSRDLAEVLNSGIEAYKNVNSDLFLRNGFEIVSSFTLDKSIGGGAEVEITPITIGATKKRQRKSIHTVTLTFTPKPDIQPVDEKNILNKSNEIIAKSNELLKLSKELLTNYK